MPVRVHAMQAGRLGAALAAALASCASPVYVERPEDAGTVPTSLVVRVHAAQDVQASSTDLSFFTVRLVGDAWDAAGADYEEIATTSWPVELVLTPREPADPSGYITVSARARTGTRPLGETRATTRFVDGERRVLNLLLAPCGVRGICEEAANCLGPTCETCDATSGACITTPFVESVPASR